MKILLFLPIHKIGNRIIKLKQEKKPSLKITTMHVYYNLALVNKIPNILINMNLYVNVIDRNILKYRKIN